MKSTVRLEPLTSLRFIAAAMIVFHHTISMGLFGSNSPLGYVSNWGQGVSFFFVLSGFILAHVYPKLETWSEIRRFLLARFARVWPALAFSSILAIWLLSLDWNYGTALANLLMINAWIPYINYYFAYNSPSWSISTEVFFYLTFPLIIYKWKNNWLYKLLLSFSILIFMFLASNILQLQAIESIDEKVTKTGLLYISPATRIFEFIFGVFLASVRSKYSDTINWSRSRSTAYEITSIIAVAASMFFMPKLGNGLFMTFGEKAASYWLTFGGSMFSFGLLIYITSMQRGWISAFLAHPALVLLGEISFSIYLLHQIFLRYYVANIIAPPYLPKSVEIAIFWTILILASYLMWATIETPCRRLILGYTSINPNGAEIVRQFWRNFVSLVRITRVAAVSLVLLVSAIYLTKDQSAFVNLQRRNIPPTADSLSYFSARGDLETVNLLIKAGVDLNSKNSTGGNALIDASWAGQEEVVAALLKGGANANIATDGALTALGAAVMQKHFSVALLLLYHGANSTSKCNLE
jgi:peptidoglycan/LPS O-acetylase OafA/YrhL